MSTQKKSLGDVILPLATIGVIGYGIKKISDIFNTENENAEEEMDDIDKEIDETEGTATYTEAQFSSFANLLEAAMEGMGTDEEAIYGVIAKMYSKLDVLLLIKTFGVRWYKEFGPVGENYTLGQWFQNELSDYSLDVINNILSQRGIQWSF